MVIAGDDGIEARYFPIANLNLPWIRETWGPGSYKITMRDALGKPRFGHRTVGVRAPKDAPQAAPEAPAQAPRTEAELALEQKRLELQYQQKSLEAEAARQQHFFTEMKELLLRAQQPAAPPGLSKADLEATLARERETSSKIAELQTKLAVAEVTGSAEDDGGGEDGWADSILSVMEGVNTLCANPHLGPHISPFVAAFIAQAGAPLLESMAEAQEGRVKKREAKQKAAEAEAKAVAEAEEARKLAEDEASRIAAEAAKAQESATAAPPPRKARARRSRVRNGAAPKESIPDAVAEPELRAAHG